MCQCEQILVSCKLSSGSPFPPSHASSLVSVIDNVFLSLPFSLSLSPLSMSVGRNAIFQANFTLCLTESLSIVSPSQLVYSPSFLSQSLIHFIYLYKFSSVNIPSSSLSLSLSLFLSYPLLIQSLSPLSVYLFMYILINFVSISFYLILSPITTFFSFSHVSFTPVPILSLISFTFSFPHSITLSPSLILW